MKKKQLLAGLLGMFMLLSGFGSLNSVFAEGIVLKISSHLPVRHRLYQDAYKAYCNEITRRTQGKVTFKWFHAGSLAKAGKTLQAVRSGLVDIVMPATVWVKDSRFPVNKVMHLPFLFDSSLHGSQVYYEAFNTIPEMALEFSEVKMIGFHTTDITDLLTVGPSPITMEQMKGMKLWTGSKSAMDYAKLLGSSPTILKLQDLYLSMQRGMIQGAFFPIAPARSYKLVEVVQNHLILNLQAGLQPMIMNLRTWKSLPPDVQAVFEEMIKPASYLTGSTLKNESEWVLKELAKRGDRISYLSVDEKKRWQEMARPIYDAWIEEVSAKGIDGRKILNQIQAIAAKTRVQQIQPEAWWGRAGKRR